MSQIVTVCYCKQLKKKIGRKVSLNPSQSVVCFWVAILMDESELEPLELIENSESQILMIIVIFDIMAAVGRIVGGTNLPGTGIFPWQLSLLLLLMLLMLT
jgi:hypothetical protein